MKSTQLRIECKEEHICPELQFVVDYIFHDRLGFGEIDLVPTQESDFFTLYQEGQLLIQIPNADFFGQESKYTRKKMNLMVQGSGGEAHLFPVIHSVNTERHERWDFDLFAAVFHVITRMEELRFKSQDPHGRFLSTNSWMSEAECLQIPIVDVWIKSLKGRLERRGLSVKREAFEWWNTIDIDQIYASKNKPLVIRLGQVAKSVVRGDVGDALAVLSSLLRGKDPFDTLASMHAPSARNICFVLLQSISKFDPAHNKDENAIMSFAQRHQLLFEVGLHPSYNSSTDIGTLRKEMDLAKQWIHQKIDMSRQHYLHFSWPQTLEQLLEMGIKFEFSMGFPDGLGFRAGTSRPFPFFDLKKRVKTPLTIVPFSVMDVTLRHYMKLSPEDSIGRLRTLIETVRTYDGMFISLWHNETYGEINGWKPWKKVFEEMKAIASK